MALPDRVALLDDPLQTAVTGIDFVAVDPTQTRLDVFFLKDPAAVVPALVNDLPPERVRIESLSGGESIAKREQSRHETNRIRTAERRASDMVVAPDG